MGSLVLHIRHRHYILINVYISWRYSLLLSVAVSLRFQAGKKICWFFTYLPFLIFISIWFYWLSTKSTGKNNKVPFYKPWWSPRHCITFAQWRKQLQEQIKSKLDSYGNKESSSTKDCHTLSSCCFLGGGGLWSVATSIFQDGFFGWFLLVLFPILPSFLISWKGMELDAYFRAERYCLWGDIWQFADWFFYRSILWGLHSTEAAVCNNIIIWVVPARACFVSHQCMKSKLGGADQCLLYRGPLWGIGYRHQISALARRQQLHSSQRQTLTDLAQSGSGWKRRPPSTCTGLQCEEEHARKAAQDSAL